MIIQSELTTPYMVIEPTHIKCTLYLALITHMCLLTSLAVWFGYNTPVFSRCMVVSTICAIYHCVTIYRFDHFMLSIDTTNNYSKWIVYAITLPIVEDCMIQISSTTYQYVNQFRVYIHICTVCSMLMGIILEYNIRTQKTTYIIMSSILCWLLAAPLIFVRMYVGANETQTILVVSSVSEMWMYVLYGIVCMSHVCWSCSRDVRIQRRVELSYIILSIMSKTIAIGCIILSQLT
jgi:hypothetical protein